LTLDSDRRELRRGSELIPVQPQVFDLLLYLVQNRDRVVSKDDLIRAIWGGRIVSDSTLNSRINAARKAVGDSGDSQTLIRTIARKGLRFVGAMQASNNTGLRLTELTAPLVTTGTRDEGVPQPQSVAGSASPDGERRQLTVVSCGLVGSVALSVRLDPEDLHTLIKAYQQRAADLIEKFGGNVAKYLGDGVLAYFGYPQAHEDDAERAVRASLALIGAAAALDAAEPLQVRVGIATGLVVVGDVVGAGVSREQALVGQTPNSAVHLRALAKPSTIVISESTRNQIGSLFDLSDLGPRNIKGIVGTQRVWQIIKESEIKSRFEALRSSQAPLVGRDEEVALLKRRWQAAKAGQSHLVLISAEPGVGKSRLTAALVDDLRSEDHATIRYFCSPNHQDSALHPVIGQLEQAACFQRGDTAETKYGKLKKLVDSYSHVEEDVIVFADLLSLSVGCSKGPLNWSPQRKKEKTLDALVRQLAAIAARQPVLLIFEDIHWIDPTSREFLDLIIGRINELPILLVATFRPEFSSPWEGQFQATTLVLARLARRDAATLVHHIAGDSALMQEKVIAEIVERCDGVPLFLEEVTKAALQATGADASQAKTIELIGLEPVPSVPATLYASLMARLDRLGSAAKDAARIGAAIGRDFSYELLAAASQQAPAQLNDALNRLTEAGVIFERGKPPHASYLFKHALVQDAVYSTLLRAPRQHLHARIADILMEVSDVETPSEIVARHLQSADRKAEAIVYWNKAGERAVQRASNREAINHFRRALALLETQPETEERGRVELAVLSQLTPALMAVYGMAADEVRLTAEKATQVGRRLKALEELAPSIANLWLFHFASGNLTAAEEISSDLFRIARELNSPGVLLQAHHAAWPVDWVRGSLASAAAHIDKGLAIYDEEHHCHHRYTYLGHDPAVCGLAIASQLYRAIGQPTRAGEAGSRALALARRLKHEPTLVHALWFVTEGQIVSLDVEAVLRNTSEILELSRDLPQQRATGLVFRGWALVASGNILEGLALAHEGIDWLERSANKGFLARLYLPVAEAYFFAGRHAEGLQMAERGLQILVEMDNAFCRPRMLQIHAKLQQAMGRDENAEASLAQSLDLARAQGSKLFELRAATEIARCWYTQGRRDEMRDLLKPICDSFSDGLDTPDFRTAKELLEAP